MTPRGGAPQAGHLSVTCPWSKDVLFNVVRGRWPGGVYGIVCHEVRLLEPHEPGTFRGAPLSTARGGLGGFLRDAALPLPVGGGSEYIKVPYTSAGSRVPHLGSLRDLHVARRGERYTKADRNGVWRERPLDDLGVQDHWIAAARKPSDEAVLERLLAGPVRDLLATQQGLGFEIRIEYGQVIVSRQDFLSRDEDLDALVSCAEAVARATREICLPGGPLRPLHEPVPPPEWLSMLRNQPSQTVTGWPIGAKLEKVAEIARERGMAVEDAGAFHLAFAGLNVPGEAFGVLRGTLPGTTLSGRLLCCAERRMHLPEELRKLLSDPGGSVGCDVAVLAVDPATPTTAPEGELDGDLRVSIEDGAMTVWRTRKSWQADGRSLDQLALDVSALISRRGVQALSGEI